jgi:hypothetical protein
LSFVFALSASANDSHFNNEKCKDKQEQPKDKKINTLPAQFNYYEEETLRQESIDFEETDALVADPIDVDTTSSSISKYNYLFYFIYKYKFENKLGVDQIERLITD